MQQRALRAWRASPRSEVHQPTLIENEVRRAAGRPRRAARRRGDRTGPTTRRCARSPRAPREAAESAPADPDFPGFAPPAELPPVEGYDEETAALPPRSRRASRRRRSTRPSLDLYGYFTSGVTELALASTTGVARRAADDGRGRARPRRGRRRLGLRGADLLAASAGSTRPRAAERGRREGRAHARRGRARARLLPRGARAVRVRRAAPLLRLRRLQRARPDRGAQLRLGPGRREGLRRALLDRRRPARPARAAEGVRLRGHAEAARRAGRGRRARAASSGIAPTAKRAGGGQQSTGNAPPAAARGTGARSRSRSRSQAARRARRRSSPSWSATGSTSRACTT